MSSQNSTADHWTAETYAGAANFVHMLTAKVVKDLDPQSNDVILDLGCGDGALTAKIASMVTSIYGLDSSRNFIEHAQETYARSKYPNLKFGIEDCANLEIFTSQNSESGKYTKVFSNAALHWIMRDPSRRGSTLRNIRNVLQAGGTFVFEMGGAGNVAEVHAALIAGLIHAGVPVAEARASSPWFFPSDVLMAQMLSDAGFKVEKCELEYRPTKLEEGHGGGLEGWVRLMGAQMLERVSVEQREGVVQWVLSILNPICTRDEGGEWLGYVRLRAVARKE